jgi:hypothetical protein
MKVSKVYEMIQVQIYMYDSDIKIPHTDTVIDFSNIIYKYTVV